MRQSYESDDTAPESKNLPLFKEMYQQYKTYFLAPGVLSEDGTQLKPLLELGIYKGKIHLKHVSEITEHDMDFVLLNRAKDELR